MYHWSLLTVFGFLHAKDVFCFRHVPHRFSSSQGDTNQAFRIASNLLCLQKDASETDSTLISKDALVESFELQNWGLFDHSVLTLGSQPLFAVITGETGSGKSVLISALQYLYSISGVPIGKKNGRGKNNFFLSNPNSINDKKSIVKLCKGDEKYVKLYDSKNKKTFCELNGKKSTIKNMGNNLKNDIRFWSSESLIMLDNGPYGFINYVDKNLCVEGYYSLNKIEIVFNEWIKTHNELLDLKILKKRKDENNEIETFTYFLDEILLFKRKLNKLLIESYYSLFEINEILFFSPSGRSESIKNEIEIKTTASAIDSLLESIKESIPELRKGKKYNDNNDIENSSSNEMDNYFDNFDISKLTFLSWTCLDFFMKLSNTSKDNTVDNDERENLYNNNMNNKNRINNDKYNIKTNNLDTIIEIINSYDNKISNLQKEFENLGFYETNLDFNINELQITFQNIIKSVKKAQNDINNIEEYLPLKKIKDLIIKLQFIKIEFDNLCRKHHVNHKELQLLNQKWLYDIKSMNNLIYTIPVAEKKEKFLREEYTEIAFNLTKFRVDASYELAKRVNKILPELEMKDKQIGIRFDLKIDFYLNSKLNYNENKNDNDKNSNKGNNNNDDDNSGNNENNESRIIENWMKILFEEFNTSNFEIKNDFNDYVSKNNNNDINNSDNNNDKNNTDYNNDAECNGEKNRNDNSYDIHKNKKMMLEIIKNISENIKPHGTVTSTGWDDISIAVRPYNQNINSPLNPINLLKGNNENNNIDMKDYIFIIFNDDNNNNDNNDNKNDEKNNKNYHCNDINILSSGESTRLALALETCTYVHTPKLKSDTTNNENKNKTGNFFSSIVEGKINQKNKFENLLILDEIDAHIGGEAAVAVARLLKEQGKWRQIVAVTHNPLIAALADKHFVVTKKICSVSNNINTTIVHNNSNDIYNDDEDDDEDDNCNGRKSKNHDGDINSHNDNQIMCQINSTFQLKSSLCQVVDNERENEIARMATGGSHTDAGLNLAKALLAPNSK